MLNIQKIFEKDMSYADRMDKKQVSLLLYINKNSIRDARTPQPGEIVFNTMRYRNCEPVHRLGYFQRSVSVQIMFK